MNCFNHLDVPAVGICKACQKGLCMECAVDLGHGIACKNHREDVEKLVSIQADNMRALQNAEALVRALPGILLGIFLILIGNSFGTYDLFLILIGAVTFCLSVISFAFTRMKKTQNK